MYNSDYSKDMRTFATDEADDATPGDVFRLSQPPPHSTNDFDTSPRDVSTTPAEIPGTPPVAPNLNATPTPTGTPERVTGDPSHSNPPSDTIDPGGRAAHARFARPVDTRPTFGTDRVGTVVVETIGACFLCGAVLPSGSPRCPGCGTSAAELLRLSFSTFTVFAGGKVEPAKRKPRPGSVTYQDGLPPLGLEGLPDHEAHRTKTIAGCHCPGCARLRHEQCAATPAGHACVPVDGEPGLERCEWCGFERPWERQPTEVPADVKEKETAAAPSDGHGQRMVAEGRAHRERTERACRLLGMLAAIAKNPSLTGYQRFWLEQMGELLALEVDSRSPAELAESMRTVKVLNEKSALGAPARLVAKLAWSLALTASGIVGEAAEVFPLPEEVTDDWGSPLTAGRWREVGDASKWDTATGDEAEPCAGPALDEIFGEAELALWLAAEFGGEVGS